MRQAICAVLASLSVVAWLAASPAGSVAASKDQSQIGTTPDQSNESVLPNFDNPGPIPREESVAPDLLEADDIPVIESVELTEDSARRAVDAYASVRDKYNSTKLEEFETLEQFVEGTDDGKEFEADIKKHGFATVTEWNTTIMAVGFAYSAVVENQEGEIRNQIEELKSDQSLDKNVRDRMVNSLAAMLPSDNNKAVLRKLVDDNVYRDRLKTLIEEE